MGKQSKWKSESETVHSALVTYFSMISLLTLCPPFVILLWYTMTVADGSVSQTWDYLTQNGLKGFLHIWPKPTALSCKIIAIYAVYEAALQLLLPGQIVYGPISPTGHRPVYKANVTFRLTQLFGIFNPTIVYDHLGEIYSALIFGSFVFCIFLYIKGHLAPSSTDSGSSGNFIIDFYWGMDLYPRIGKYFDIKVFTNCRFGMMSWAVLALTYCIKQYEENGKVADSMLVNTTLMLVYVTKFFWWEAGYWNTMDIAHDRAGFYICWGCLVWVPSVYTSPGMYLVNHPVNLGTQLALSILVAGILCIYINYDCDRQRQEFRRTNGKGTVWGKPPSKIEASYTTTAGETKRSLLLTSGWWGLSRHFHYVPEILAAFFWTVPALFNHFLPYFYVIFLTILLFDRAKRDDDRCRSKYGKYWKLYCDKNHSRNILKNDYRQMSAYENVVGGKLKLKGKALDVAGGVKKKKKKNKRNNDQFLQVAEDEISAGGSKEEAGKDGNDEDINDVSKLSGKGKTAHYDDHLTPAERRYIEQREQLDVHRLAKISNKSHRDRIQDFNQYLANMSEHYDIPKVGPG
ncbi:7-dehydrocholesterol reductase, partial [Mucuna pruriens]